MRVEDTALLLRGNVGAGKTATRHRNPDVSSTASSRAPSQLLRSLQKSTLSPPHEPVTQECRGKLVLG